MNIKDITIIIPLHKFSEDYVPLFKNALNSVVENRKTYKNGELKIMLVGPVDVIEKYDSVASQITDGIERAYSYEQDTDFCTLVNIAAKHQGIADHFSILEFDDTYSDRWFKMASDYFYGNENVSLFLPINVVWSAKLPGQYQFMNEIAWTGAFSNEIGFLDFDGLQDYPSFNLTGGIFNTSDFNKIGGFKPSIKVAFNYELLLRMTKKELKVYVVPKEGYTHVIGRDESLTDEYSKTLTPEEIKKWFDVAKIEYAFTEDRHNGIENIKEEKIK